jgi:hypothetical protein
MSTLKKKGSLAQTERKSRSRVERKGQKGRNRQGEWRERTFDDKDSVLVADLEDLELALTRSGAAGRVGPNGDSTVVDKHDTET